MKDVIFKNCKLNRIDSHQPSHNITIKDCIIGIRGIGVTGFGKLIVKDTISYSSAFINLRSDYGSFWNGDIIIDNVDHYAPTVPKVFLLNPTIDWNFGIDTFFGDKSVQVTNYRLHDKGLTGFTPYFIYFNNDSTTLTPARDYYKLCKNITFKNCTTDTGIGFALFRMLNYKNLRAKTLCEFERGIDESISLKENLIITLDTITMDSSTRFPSSTDSNISNLFQPINGIYDFDVVNTYSLDHLAPKFIIRNCKDVYASVRGMRASFDIENSTVVTLMNYIYGGTNAKIFIKNSIIEPRFDITNDNKFVIRGFYPTTTFLNTTFNLPRSVNGRLFTSDKTTFLQVYSLFENFINSKTITIGAKLIACSLGASFNQEALNPDINSFESRLENMSKNSYPRQIGTSTNRPITPLTKTTYFDESLNKEIIYIKTKWVDSNGVTV